MNATLVGSPFSTIALKSGAAEFLAKDIDPGGTTTYFMYSGRFMRERPGVATHIMAALIRGARDLQPKLYLSPEHFPIFEKYTGAKEAEIRATTPVTYHPDLAINTKSLQEQEAIHRESDWVKYTAPVPVAHMDVGVQQEALKVVGAYKR